MTGSTDGLPRWLQLVIWTDLLAYPINPVLGAGFESFWLGERLEVLWKNGGGRQMARNGYIEIYLNLGLVGLVMLGGWIKSGFRNAGSIRNILGFVRGELIRISA